MASARAMLERRRASRIAIRIPVRVFSGDVEGGSLAEALSISRCGALLRTTFLPELGSRITVVHGISAEVREFRVIRVSGPNSEGFFEVGIEILFPERNFWGMQFPGER
ncbi:MAG: hypothetical protein LAN59_12855 [Acidobacteriia bacterium]|nr:hypothetical protein [Terriglobia bacterium]